MSLSLISLTSTLCLLIVGCLADHKMLENGVPLLIGETTEVRCDLSDIKGWTHNEKEVEINKKHSFLDDMKILQIHRSDYNDEGNYTCNASGSSKMFVVKGKPRFKITSTKGRIDVKSIHAIEGSDIDMICYIPNKVEIPQEENYSFVWYKGDAPANAELPRGRQYTLTISNINQSDRDTYKCVAWNGVQNHSESIRLRVKDKITYVWPLAGIVCEVVILILVILIFEQRGVKPEYESNESDNDNTDVKKSS